MKRIYVFPFSVFLFSVSAYAGPSVLEQGLVVSNGLTVASGQLLVRDGTNLVPVLKQGDVMPGASAVPDGLTIVSNANGRLAIAPRYDANYALLAARVAALDGMGAGMVDAWYWQPNSLSGIANTGRSVFVVGEGLKNFTTTESFDSIVTSDTINTEYTPKHVRVLLCGEGSNVVAFFAVSRDGGTSWAAVSTEGFGMDPLPYYGEGPFKIYSGDIDLTDQPPGTSLVFRVETIEEFPCTLRLFGGSWR
jgi:hypothetical protein